MPARWRAGVGPDAQDLGRALEFAHEPLGRTVACVQHPLEPPHIAFENGADAG